MKYKTGAMCCFFYNPAPVYYSASFLLIGKNCITTSCYEISIYEILFFIIFVYIIQKILFLIVLYILK